MFLITFLNTIFKLFFNLYVHIFERPFRIFDTNLNKIKGLPIVKAYCLVHRLNFKLVTIREI